MANRRGVPVPLMNRTLYDDFTVKGKWWLPAEPDGEPVRVDGILTVKAGDDMLLEVFAPLTRPGKPPMDGVAQAFSGRNDDLAIIHGLSDSGTAITLFNSMV